MSRRTHTLHLYQAADGWRWRRRAGNHKIISDSAEGYVDRRDAIHGMHLANPDHERLRLIDDADNLALTDADTDGEDRP